MAESIRQGDIILVDRLAQGWISAAVKLGGKLRYGFVNSHTRYSHAVIVYDASEPTAIRVVEATARGGVHISFLSRYKPGDYDVVHTHVTDHDWPQVKAFLDEVLEERTGYGFATYAGLTLYAVTGSKLCIQRAGTAICSGLVCDALTRAGYIWNRPPFACTPADISVALQPAGAPRVRVPSSQ